MRRNDREVTDIEAIHEIIRKARVGRLAMCKDNVPYLLPLSFGFDGEALYFHCAPEGQKIDFLRANPTVCFEFEGDMELKVHGSSPCAWGFTYQSVIGTGTAEELVEEEDKIAGLNHIMKHFSGREWDYPEKAVKSLAVWKVSIGSLTGKQA